MPELPEVEYVRRNLQRWTGSVPLSDVVVSDAHIVRPTTAKTFSKRVTGRTCTEIRRRGKWIRVLLDDEQRLFLHLGMTGWLEHVTVKDSNNPHPAAGDNHLRFEKVRWTAKDTIVFVDARRWGRIILARLDIPSWTQLGADPLDDGIDIDALHKKLVRRKATSIKEALMDQRLLAGVGNIQAIEALWHARIDPRTKASTVSKRDLAGIARGIRWTIDRTLGDLEGTQRAAFKIYGRKGSPCPRRGCDGILERTELGGRTTTFCPGCQR